VSLPGQLGRSTTLSLQFNVVTHLVYFNILFLPQFIYIYASSLIASTPSIIRA
jgi:hypothetical protein